MSKINVTTAAIAHAARGRRVRTGSVSGILSISISLVAALS